MATYVNDLRLKEIATGDESGTWGTSTNTNLELIAEAFSFGTEAITTNADTHTTTLADGATDPGRSMFLKYTGTLDSTCTITIGPNTISKLWFIENATSGSQSIIIKQGSGATVTIANGQVKAIYSDGAGSGGAMVDAFTDLSVPSFFVSGALDVGGALTGTNATFTTADNTSQLTIKSTDDDANAGPVFDLVRDSASPADNDVLGRIRFRGDNDAGEETTMVYMQTNLLDASDGTEDAGLDLFAQLGGTLRRRITLSSTEAVFNEDSQNLDFRVESDGNANMLFVDAGNDRVGIGTSSPSQPFHVDATGGTTAALFDNNGSNGDVVRVAKNGTDVLKIRAEGTADLALDANGGAFIFKEGGAEAARITSAGTLLVGKTADDNSAGFKTNTSSTYMVASGQTPAFINRLSDDGDVLEFRKDSSAVGAIGTVDADLTVFSKASGHKGLRFGNGYIAPTNNAGTIEDNSTDLGLSTHRYKDLHLSGAVNAAQVNLADAGGTFKKRPRYRQL